MQAIASRDPAAFAGAGVVIAAIFALLGVLADLARMSISKAAA